MWEKITCIIHILWIHFKSLFNIYFNIRWLKTQRNKQWQTESADISSPLQNSLRVNRLSAAASAATLHAPPMLDVLVVMSNGSLAQVWHRTEKFELSLCVCVYAEMMMMSLLSGNDGARLLRGKEKPDICLPTASFKGVKINQHLSLNRYKSQRFSYTDTQPLVRPEVCMKLGGQKWSGCQKMIFPSNYSTGYSLPQSWACS